MVSIVEFCLPILTLALLVIASIMHKNMKERELEKEKETKRLDLEKRISDYNSIKKEYVELRDRWYKNILRTNPLPLDEQKLMNTLQWKLSLGY
jgi:hypothetical protein